MTDFLIWGIGGRLGANMLECLNKSDDVRAVGGVDKFADPTTFNIPVFKEVADIDIKVDVVVDFSRPDAVFDILPFCAEKGVPVVLATTGHTDKHMEFINAYADKIAIFKASNMSLGINLLIDLARKATKALGQNFDIEIIEQHHNIKVDAPSGTALSIAKAINEECDSSKEFVYGRHSMNERRKKSEIGIHAVRGGTIVGKHEILFIGNDEIITLSHEANSKAVFSEGAIKAGKFLVGKAHGMYDMIDLINER